MKPITEYEINNIVQEATNKVLKEADRHRPGYWKER